MKKVNSKVKSSSSILERVHIPLDSYILVNKLRLHLLVTEGIKESLSNLLCEALSFYVNKKYPELLDTDSEVKGKG